jgi:NADH-quinone oxidoreductase subunit N
VNLHELVSELIIDTKGSADSAFWSFTSDSSLGVFRPEMTLCATIVLMLLVRLFRWGRNVNVAWIALAGSVLALFFAAPWALLDGTSGVGDRLEIFTGMLVYDGFSVFVRGLLLAFLVLFIAFTSISGIPDRDDGPDIYTLVLGATLGFCLMASANHLLMVFMAIEMASVPSYVLAGMLKGRKLGSEAALKYAVYGAGAAGVMLYGISLVAGLVNAVHLPTVAQHLADQLPGMAYDQLMVLALGTLFIMVGLAFKLSAVPFHFWCPDVFEGATAEVGGFLSVASKAAALALLVRVALGFGMLAPTAAATETAVTLPAPKLTTTAGLFAIEDQVDTGQPSDGSQPAASGTNASLQGARHFLGRLIALIALVTCTFGNLAAYSQTNIKRLLAYSTIAHAGYMMMAVPPILELAAVDANSARHAVAALAVYLAVYLFMNLGAFAVVAFLRNAMHSEQISDYAGLLRRCPGMAICFSAMLLSLIGLPPLAGFLGKFAVFAAIADGFRFTNQSYLMALLVGGGLNTAISLFYYLRVVKLMTMDPEPEDRAEFSLPMGSPAGIYILVLTIPTIVLIIFWEPLNRMAISAAANLFA